MARTKKDTTTTATETAVKATDETKTVDTTASTDISSLEKLKKENEELKAQFEELKALISNQKNTQTVSAVVQANDTVGSKYIKVVSLYDGILNMYTGESCSGKLFTFTSVGQSTKVLNQELRDLVRVNLSFFQKGYCYICDTDFIEDVGLAESYENIIDPEVFTALANGSKSSEAVSIFESANETQKKNLVDIIIRKIANGELPQRFADTIDPDGDFNIKDKVKETKNIYEDYISNKGE